MAGIAERQQEVRATLRGLGLKPGDHLERVVRRRDAVVQCGDEEHRRICAIGPDRVIGRVASQIEALDRVVGGAVLDRGRGPEATPCPAQHVEVRHPADDRAEGVGGLHRGHGDEQPTVAVATREESSREGVAGRDEPARRRDVVVEGVLPLRPDGRLVPGAAELAAAADVGVGHDPAELEPGGVERHEPRLVRDVEAAVAAQAHRSGAIEHEIASMDEGHGHTRAVGATRTRPGRPGSRQGPAPRRARGTAPGDRRRSRSDRRMAARAMR